MKVWMIVILITGIIACFVQAQEMSPRGRELSRFL